jgi:hypothetical protein
LSPYGRARIAKSTVASSLDAQQLGRRAAQDRRGRLGSLAAPEIISHIGARPESGLQDLARKAGLLD